jgi:transglutaminase-like putative cysteine protease
MRKHTSIPHLPDGPWILTLISLVVLSASYLSVLYHAVDVTGDLGLFFLFVAGALIGGVLAGRFISSTVAYICTVIIAIIGMALYVPTIPESYTVVISLDLIWSDLVALLTGLSILRIINAGVWSTAVAPVPVFLTAYFASRRKYSAATLVGCAALGFFILTSDVNMTTGLIGVLAAVAAIGFGDLDRGNGTIGSADTVAIVLAVVIVLTVSVSVVPGGQSSPVFSGGGSSRTIEASLTNADNRISIQGSISLSPTVRFTVESEQRAYWRVGAYNRYTGSGWIRTAGSYSYNSSLPSPPGPTQSVKQTIQAKTSINIMPAAWKPTTVDGYPTRVTGFGGLQPENSLESGDTYTVVSSVPAASPDALRNAGTDYPNGVTQRYTQLPSSTPDRVEQYTTNLTRKSENPYDTARIIENHLQTNWNYSLKVPAPSGHVAATFLFDREKGYCTYYATTMVVMLRTQGIPARFVVGYTSGQQVNSNQWVVRGLDSHAWVEAYFPEYGWIRFDPTPSEPRQQAEQSVIETARSQNVEGVDTNESKQTPTPTTPTENTSPTAPETPTTTPPQNPSGPQPAGPSNPSRPAFTPPPGAISGGVGNGTVNEESGFQLTLPPRDQMLFGTLILVGIAAAIRRSGVGKRAYREVWLRRQPRTDPKSDIERAYERLEYLLEREYRPRQSGESRRQYVRRVGDDRARRIGEIYEQAVYAGNATESLADEAVDLVDQRVHERSRLWSRLPSSER